MTKSKAPQHQNTYDQITAKIIAAVEANPGKPVMPWHRAAGQTLLAPSNAVTKHNYRGINVILLWLTALERNYATSQWASYKQWAAAGAQVRGGETSTQIVFFKEFEVEPKDAGDSGKRLTARTYAVFNASQVDGYDGADVAPALDHGPIQRTAAFEAFVAATKANITWEGARAYYRPSTDAIVMPEERLFTGTKTMERSESAMAVLAHELLHWSGHKSRLDRNFAKRFKTDEVAAEELTAEIGAAFICSQLGISAEPRADHAQYVAHWLTLMKGDSRAIFAAATAASKATDYLLAFSAAAPPWADSETGTDTRTSDIDTALHKAA
jgi:antirestriction protein ArdC